MATPQNRSQFDTGQSGTSLGSGLGSSSVQGATPPNLQSGGTKTQTTYKREHEEGPVARGIEHQTAKLPSDLFLWTALGCIGVSLVMQAAGAKHRATFVGQWAPTLLILGLYNKVVKVAGHDEITGHSPQTT